MAALQASACRRHAASETHRAPSLSDRYYVTVIVRLLLERDGRLVAGEVARARATESQRFADWQDLSSAVRQVALGRKPDGAP